MTLQEKIISAFTETIKEPVVSDKFIIKNQNIMELGENTDYFKYVPSYMVWCIKHKSENEELIDEYTINTLAEFGKTKSMENTYLNFMYKCNKEQKLVVIAFLTWCSTELSLVNEAQIERAIRNWS